MIKGMFGKNLRFVMPARVSRKRSRSVRTANGGVRKRKAAVRRGRPVLGGLVKRLGRLGRVPETKSATYGFDGAFATSTNGSGGELDPATFLGIGPLAQGFAGNERVGRKMVIQDLFLSGMANYPAANDVANGVNSPVVFVALVLDRNTNGGQMNSEDVFQNIAGTNACAAAPIVTADFKDRFLVLDHVQLKFSALSPVTDGTGTFAVSGEAIPFTLQWHGEIPIDYNAVTGTITALVTNSVHVMGFTTSTSLVPRVSYQCRMQYADA